MEDAALRDRLWRGFAELQELLGGQAAGGAILQRDGIVASFVPGAPDSPTLNAAIALAHELDPRVLQELEDRFGDVGARRWGFWTDGGYAAVVRTLRRAGLRMSSSSRGMAAEIEGLELDGAAPAETTDLATVGRVNDLAYGNPDGRLERTLAPLPADRLRAYRADLDGRPASVALALHHDGDCGISFVATAPEARRRGLASDVMQRVAVDAREAGCTSASLQATDLGERLYTALGYRAISDMQLWERRI